MARVHKLDGEGEYERMLVAIAHDLSLPLLQIKSLAGLDGRAKVRGDELNVLVESGLRLIESYLMALELKSAGNQLVLEPVSIGSVLNESAHELGSLAKHYNTKIEVKISSKTKPILTNKTKLQAALYCLAASMIRSQVAEQEENLVVLGAHKNRADNLTAGVYAKLAVVTDKQLYNARRLAGRASQPFPSMPAHSGGGILIADMLLTSLYMPLKASKFSDMSGFATQFPLSKQLRLV